ncbi:hypothetical protein PHAVU_011G162100 [Phaseolus vulgaris]|uniref:Peptide N-acetyl-beta-D-glucosaminyl asparaginase amidase A N-terminal domain-containing protein n=1 Tax=Phaseolus vulgaris TaxID=3885 RepID=V7AJ13_PHAVU|nr:hypothetical protein PHAVU_011G162100g [Phaseolus vulgaris]ESW05220.1 hypothetical protein PHAVU_011G162100g [Phaseolus vulgaris]
MNNYFLLFVFLIFSHFLSISASSLYKIKQHALDFPSEFTSSDDPPPPTEYFEVTRPIELPKTKPFSHHILQHDFGFTYGKPPVLANYTPPSHCPFKTFSKIVLEWKATCRGRQFDRIFGVWLGGVELLRSCTAEPRATGIVWSVHKDITRYHSLLLNPQNQTFAVFLGNVVDKTYTGVYHVDVTIHFYPFVRKSFGDGSDSKAGALAFGGGVPADLVLPISRNPPLNDGLWFVIDNSTAEGLKEFRVPQNAYRAVLEVYVSFHERDEFWYGNPPEEYLIANNLSDVPGSGPFREVVVSLDGKVVGAVWPFTVIYTGGVNPLLWRPITGIGSFDLPSYDIEITPLLGSLLDGKSHSVGFTVTNALNLWFVDANLHIWLDWKSSKTEGGVLDLVVKPLAESLVTDFEGLNGKFWTSARRSIFSSGWIRSSYGNVTTSFVQDFVYNNSMVMAKDGNKQIVKQLILFNDSVHANLPSPFVQDTHRNFSLYLNTDEVDQDNDTSLSVSNVTLGFNVDKSRSSAYGFSKRSVENVQDGQGTMVIQGNLVVRGVGETHQDYTYTSDDGHCYSRKVGSSNFTILYDKIRHSCNKRSHSHLGPNPFKKLFYI